MAPVALAGVLAGGMLVAGCGDDDGGSAASTTAPGVTDVAPDGPEALASADVDAPAAGEVRVVLGRSVDTVLTVSSCTLDPGAEPDGEIPAELVALRASGTTDDGSPVNLDLRRFRSAGASTTITDTVTVAVGDPEGPDLALVAQRFEVDGVVTDGRDPDADDPLVRTSGETVEARGVFAPPGAFVDDGGLVEGLVVARCEG